MAKTYPEFTHIHSSSKFSRSPASLEHDLDDWMAKSEIITLTEVDLERKARQIREKGWGNYNHAKSAGQDKCAIAWSLSEFTRIDAWVRKLSNHRFLRDNGKAATPVYSCTVLLKAKGSGQKLLVSCTHFPAHVEGRHGWDTTGAKQAARKAAHISSMQNWSQHVKDLERKRRPEGVLVVADWNVNLKNDWARHYIRNHWGENYRQAWTRFPTEGGSMLGGPANPPLGSPGAGDGGRIIDGSLYHGLNKTVHPNLMHMSQSSDHRPYKESFRFTSGRKSDEDPHEDASGDTRRKADPWWGFGDYMNDEIYEVVRTTGEAGGEVL